MALTAAERAKRFRNAHSTVTEQRNVTMGVTAPVTTEQPSPYAMLPPLPTDQIITANQCIGWADVMAMPRWAIDEVYHVTTVMDDELLLRLVRAAGLRKRC